MDFSRLAIIRLKKDLSQRDLAKILNVSKSTYARWETCEQIIPLIHLNNFCEYFKVSMDYVLKIDENNNYNDFNYLKDIDKVSIGNNLKILRNRHKLTQKDLASLLNTSQSTISAYENGQTLVLTAFIYSVSRQFNVSVDKLCNRIKEKEYAKI